MNFKSDQPGAYINQMLYLEKYRNETAELYYKVSLFVILGKYLYLYQSHIQKQTKEIEHYVLVRSNNFKED